MQDVDAVQDVEGGAGQVVAVFLDGDVGAMSGGLAAFLSDQGGSLLGRAEVAVDDQPA